MTKHELDREWLEREVRALTERRDRWLAFHRKMVSSIYRDWPKSPHKPVKWGERGRK